jgi:hypothetical protein
VLKDRSANKTADASLACRERRVVENHFHPLPRPDGAAINFPRRKLRAQEGFTRSLFESGRKCRLLGFDTLNATLFVNEEQ